MKSRFRRDRTEYVQHPIVIEDGCWIGVASIVLPGVTVASGCVVGAGSVVTRSTSPNGLYVGVPATRVKDLEILHERPIDRGSEISSEEYRLETAS